MNWSNQGKIKVQSVNVQYINVHPVASTYEHLWALLTPVGARERPLNNGLRGTVVSHRVFIRSQSLIAR